MRASVASACVLLSVSLLAPQPGLAGRRVEPGVAEALLADALRSSWRGERSKPFRLQARLVMKRAGTVGTYALYWGGPEQWREELELFRHREVRVRDEDGLWIEHRSDLPQRWHPWELASDVREAMDPARVLRLGPDETVTVTQSQRHDDRDALRMRIEDPEGWPRWATLDTETGVLVASTGRGAFAVDLDFENAVSVDGRWFPARVRIPTGPAALTIVVEELEPLKRRDHRLLTRPALAVGGRVASAPGCDDFTPAAPRTSVKELGDRWRTADASASSGHDHAHEHGDDGELKLLLSKDDERVTSSLAPSVVRPPSYGSRKGSFLMELVVDDHGKVQHVGLIRSSVQPDDGLMQALSDWDHEPARCAGAPVGTYRIVALDLR